MKEIKTIQGFVIFLGENKLQLKTTRKGSHPFFMDCANNGQRIMTLKTVEETYGVKIKGLVNREFYQD